MDLLPPQSQDQRAAGYLQQLQTLASEVSHALEAVAGNRLTDFQQSVARQEMLCAVLAAMVKTIKRGAQPLSSDPAVERKIQSAVADIQQLNLQYAALLRHSGKSIALLASLCRTHTGQFEGARGPRSKRQTWSCEM